MTYQDQILATVESSKGKGGEMDTIVVKKDGEVIKKIPALLFSPEQTERIFELIEIVEKDRYSINRGK